MAKMVTRTIITEEVMAICYNPEECKTETIAFRIPKCADDKKRIKAIAEAYHVEALKIVDVKENAELYGMTETEFLAHAEILPPRSTASEDEQ